MAQQDKYAALKLDNQVCFPLYACSKEVVRRYKPFLDDYDLTYTQYIAMMVLWEDRELSVNELGQRLFLDSGTLTPLLKKLENKGYVTRKRCCNDERKVLVEVTDVGLGLRDQMLDVPAKMGGCVELTAGEAMQLHKLLHKLMDQFR